MDTLCVYTPEDSIVVGGNFLTSYKVDDQIRMDKHDKKYNLKSERYFDLINLLSIKLAITDQTRLGVKTISHEFIDYLDVSFKNLKSIQKKRTIGK